MKTYKSLSLFLFYLSFSYCFASISFAQKKKGTSLNIQLLEMPSDSTSMSVTLITFPITDTALIKNVPIGFHEQSLRYLVLRKSQYRYELFLKGITKPESWRAYKKQFAADSAYLYNNELKGNKFAVFSAIDTIKGEKFFVIDANNNNDFGDDPIMKIKIDSIPLIKNYHFKTILNSQYFDGKQLIKVDLPINIIPFQPTVINNDILHQKLGISVAFGKGLRGYLNDDDGYSYQLNMNQPNFGFPPFISAASNLSLKKYNSKHIQIDKIAYSFADTLLIGNKRYAIVDFDAKLKTLKLNYLETAVYGYSSGTLFKKTNEINFLTNQTLNWDSYSNKDFILLDFWGTWCMPCLEGIPDLRDLQLNYANTLKVLSIAYDNPKDTNLLKSMINDYKMSWDHVWVNNKIKNINSLIEGMKISSFPTFILVNAKNNKIIFRAEGADGLKQIKKIIEDSTNKN